MKVVQWLLYAGFVKPWSAIKLLLNPHRCVDSVLPPSRINKKTFYFHISSFISSTEGIQSRTCLSTLWVLFKKNNSILHISSHVDLWPSHWKVQPAAAASHSPWAASCKSLRPTDSTYVSDPTVEIQVRNTTSQPITYFFLFNIKHE